ncbi:oxidoreductase molybdopterin binding domain protein [Halolamina pelagica]|uniref:Oxidoreductase molybdopterin binding domain protein n=1 Tax=Halolamina pelagica TaxID=699431 RepID=A0A0P7GN96_9EURY|nr:oxidoreductase molybdopterin binding domain protein [Halolamina pelagica]
MNRPSSEQLADAGVGVIAGVAALAGSLLAAGDSPAFVGAGAAAVVRDTAPSFVAVGVRSLGELAQPLLVATTGVLLLGAYATLTVLVGRYVADTPTRALATLGLVGGLTLVLSGSALGALGAGIGSALVVGAANATLDLGRPTGRETPPGRRRLLQGAGVAVAALAASAIRLREPASTGDADREPRDPGAAELLSAAEDRSFSLPDTDPLVSDGFYTVDIASVDPNLGPGDWDLTVTGEVPEERTFTLSELQGMGGERRFVTLRCVSDPLNGTKIDNALWDGVPVSSVLDEAGAPESCCVTLHAADDYFVSFPARRWTTACWRGDERPPAPAGPRRPAADARPGPLGRDQRQVAHRDRDPRRTRRRLLGTARLGGHRRGENRRQTPQHDRRRRGGSSRGHAYAGTDGISAVEVSTDGGDSWTEAALTDPLPGAVPLDAENPEPDGEAADAWRMWQHEYEATERHEVVVRAIDGNGERQPEAESDLRPSGPTGWVSETIEL